jgi:hypothetical protein
MVHPGIFLRIVSVISNFAAQAWPVFVLARVQLLII